jgi:hypothetical protein
VRPPFLVNLSKIKFPNENAVFYHFSVLVSRFRPIHTKFGTSPRLALSDRAGSARVARAGLGVATADATRLRMANAAGLLFPLRSETGSLFELQSAASIGLGTQLDVRPLFPLRSRRTGGERVRVRCGSSGKRPCRADLSRHSCSGGGSQVRNPVHPVKKIGVYPRPSVVKKISGVTRLCVRCVRCVRQNPLLCAL